MRLRGNASREDRPSECRRRAELRLPCCRSRSRDGTKHRPSPSHPWHEPNPPRHDLRQYVEALLRPNARRFERYGGRGIAICDAWLSDRAAFYSWAVSNGYQDNLWIERIDRDGPYRPENCRWATPKEQANNMSRNRFLIWKGEKKTVAEWAGVLGVRSRALQHRVDRRWSLERIFTQPFRGARP